MTPRSDLGDALVSFLGALRVPEGEAAGERLEVLDWQREFVEAAFSPGVISGALSVGRGCGKTVLLAGLGAAVLAGPLAGHRRQCVIVSATLEQGRIVFDHLRELVAKGIALGALTVRKTAASPAVVHEESGSSVVVRTCSGRSLHGLAPTLILCDEPAQWRASQRDAVRSALATSLGKIAGARMLTVGTRSSDSAHWFERELTDGPGHVGRVWSAPDHLELDDPRAWEAANPSLRSPRFRSLRKVLEIEAARALAPGGDRSSFEALRLNRGVSDVPAAVLVQVGDWLAVECDDLPDRTRPLVVGVDLGGSAAMSAGAACFASGRVEAVGMFGGFPDLRERGVRDGVGDRYRHFLDDGDLVVVEGVRVPGAHRLLHEVQARWGMPDVICADRYRKGELQDALDRLGWRCEVRWRGMGYRDGSEDVRDFRAAVLSGRVSVARSRLLRSCVGEARVTTNPSGDSKLAIRAGAGRRFRARDDAAAAAVLAIAERERMRRREHVEVESWGWAIA
ncbi:hypothetical protein [Candidatus Palauibacter sp.]|uniref:hypothetical protein n=2 Tax=Candidatus Palauibacter sp. TaxID=3101350 RepID=UPI003B01E706